LISGRKRLRRVSFLLLAYSASEKLICVIGAARKACCYCDSSAVLAGD
jgi:hypothetical protein